MYFNKGTFFHLLMKKLAQLKDEKRTIDQVHLHFIR